MSFQHKTSLRNLLVFSTLLLSGLWLNSRTTPNVPTTANTVATTAASVNPIVRENEKQGTTKWKSPNFDQYINNLMEAERLEHAAKPKAADAGGGNAAPAAAWVDTQNVKGYASKTSVNVGGSLTLHVSSTASQYDLTIYRMGYYGGSGGTEVVSTVRLPGTNRANPTPDSNGMIAANWPASYTVNVGSNWVSGVYMVWLQNVGSSYVAYVPFIVRNDSQTADILYVVATSTWQAYNGWGGKSLYEYNSPDGRALKVSYDRPYDQNDGSGHYYSGDYNMIQWLEHNGYNVTYATSEDLATNPGLMNNRKVFLSDFHDEYYSMEMFDNVKAFRDAGKSLAYFTSNNIYWQIRYEANSAGVAQRVIVCYKKETDDPATSRDPWRTDADPQKRMRTTVLFRDAPVNKPENQILGVMFESLVGYGDYYNWTVQNADHWIYQGTGLTNGSTIPKLTGYEWDRIFNNGYTPANITVFGQTTINNSEGSFLHQAVIWQAPSGAWVLNVSVNYWQYFLEGNYIWPLDTRVQRMTINVLNRMITDGGGVVNPTATPSPTTTRTPTAGPSATPSQTFTPSVTFTSSATATASLTNTPSKTLTATATNTATNTPGPTTSVFYRAINMGGPALVIDGNNWEANSGTTTNLTTTGSVLCNPWQPVTPATDANRTSMIQCSRQHWAHNVVMSSVPNGTYEVYVYTWLDWADPNPPNYNFYLQGQLTANYQSGPVGKWSRLGPWTANVTAGTITIQTDGGIADISGIEVYRIVASATATPTLTSTSTATFTASATNTATNTATATASNTFTPSATNTATATFTASATNTATHTATATASNTFTPSATNTATATFTASATNTVTHTATATASNTFTPSATNTQIPASATFTPSATATNTALPPTNTATATATNTALPPTNTATATATHTELPTETFTPSATATNTALPTNTPSATFTATATDTATATNTVPPTETFTPSATATNTALPPTNTATATATNTALPPTNTATATATHTELPTETFTPSATATNTALPTNTPSATFTATATDTATATNTLPPTETFTPSATATNTATATATNTALPPTNTATATATHTEPPTETFTPSATATNTALPPTNTATATATNTALPPTETATATNTDQPIVTATPLPSNTPSATATNTEPPIVTATPLPSNTPSATIPATATDTATFTPSATNTVPATATATLTNTASATASATATNTVPATATPTASNTATVTPTGTATATNTNTPSATVTSTSTATFTPSRTLTATNTAAPSLTFYRAINIGGPALVIDGNNWEANSGTTTNFTTNGSVLSDPWVTLNPPTDTARAQMISTYREHWAFSMAMSNVPAGTYQVYLYVWQEWNNTSQQPYNITLEGATVAANYNPGTVGGKWERLGPWTINLTDGTINITTNGSGLADINGLEVYRLMSGGGASATPQPSATSTVTSTATATMTRTNTPAGATSTPSMTPSLTRTFTASATMTRTNTPQATNTSTPTSVQSSTPTLTSTPTSTGLAATATPTNTATPTSAQSNTPTLTSTPSATRTNTPVVTNTPSRTLTATPTSIGATATPSRTSTVTRTPTITPTPSRTPSGSPTFYKAYNLGGASIVIDGNTWQAGTSGDLAIGGGTTLCNQAVTLVPATDANRATMIRCSVTGTAPDISVINIANGMYDVYIYVWEDDTPSTFSMSVQAGQVFVPTVNSGTAGSWQRLGPYTVNITGGWFSVDSFGGQANFSGLEFYSR